MIRKAFDGFIEKYFSKVSYEWNNDLQLFIVQYGQMDLTTDCIGIEKQVLVTINRLKGHL